MPSKSASAGRDLIDALQGPYNSCTVHRCGKNRCKTCVNIVEGHSFSSNVSGRHYNVISNQPTMTCETDNVIYLISCGRCSIQYVGLTSQMLRKRMNNHRNRLKNTSDLYLYKHFCSDGDRAEDLHMPIEQVTLEEGDNMSLSSKRLTREKYWYKELKSIYLYGLNDNVKNIGNIETQILGNYLSCILEFRQRPSNRKSHHNRPTVDIHTDLHNLLDKYKSPGFMNRLRVYILSLPKKCMNVLITLCDILLIDGKLPKHIPLSISNLANFRRFREVSRDPEFSTNTQPRQFLKIQFTSKGLDMINLSQLVNKITCAIPSFVLNKQPPINSYLYPMTIRNKVLNHKKNIRDLTFDTGTNDTGCSCEDSPFLNRVDSVSVQNLRDP